MAKLILGPIVGGVHAHGAKIWGRADGQTMIYAWIGHEPNLQDARYVGAALLTPDTGYAGVVAVNDLQPNTRYTYALTLEESPPDPTQGPYPSFYTAPEDGAPESLAFAFGSCFLPRESADEAIFTALEQRRQEEDLRFWLLLGDQIYADAWDVHPLGRVALTADDYRAVYHHTWSRPPLRHLLAHLPSYMIWDDHEVDDDWHWTSLDRLTADIPWWDKLIRWLHGRPPEERHLTRKRVRAAIQAYWEHQVLHAPPLLTPPEGADINRPQILMGDEGHFGYSFTYGSAAFFVLDTRFHRVRAPEQKRLLNAAQWRALEAWLLQVRDRFPFKFIVSSITVLSDFWLDIARDRWNGFPDERRRLLHLIAAYRVPGLFLLTGDLHSGHAIRADLRTEDGDSLTLWEFGASPFAQKTNGLARYLWRPRAPWPVRRLHRAFVVNQPHFGVVRLRLSPQPEVTFAAYDAHNHLLHQVQVPLDAPPNQSDEGSTSSEMAEGTK